MKLDLPMMIAYLLTAAALQIFLPPVPCAPIALKFPLLPCVALYYVLDRPWPMALVAALWAGVLTDALGGLPHGTTSIPFLLLAVAFLAIRRLQPEESLVPAALLGPIVILILLTTQAVAVRASFETPPPFFASLKPIPLLALLAAVATPLFVTLARKLDLCAGNVEPKKEIGS